MLNAFQKVFAWLARLGVAPTDSDELRLSKALLTFSLLLIWVFFLFIWIPLYFVFNEPTTGVVSLLYFGLTLVAFAIFCWQPHLFRPILIFIHIAGFLTAAVTTLLLGGFVNAGGLGIWLLMAIIGAIIQFGLRYASLFFLAFLGYLALSILPLPFFRTTNNLPAWLTATALFGNLAGTSGFVLFMVYYFIQQRELAFRLLRGEQVKAENLLLNILPAEIASILKNENRVIADQFEGASILFADVVNFTPLSAQMTPVELVELLNEIFSHFDMLVEKYGLEKIKTIGDCYMVASGVPRPRTDHAQALTHMALEMQAFVASREFRGRKIAFRIGINSGPVVAGVIGRKKFIYDLWGDAVNTASRMESHGAGGIIQITRATYELIHTEFDCTPKGTVNVKGKGEMGVWHVVGLK